MRASNKNTLTVASAVSLLTFLIFSGMIKENYVSADTAFLLLFSSVLMGFYVVLAFVEKMLERYFKDFKVTVIFWGLLLAILGYVARLRAITDINGIFHIDASAFPMTLVAGTTLHLAKLMLWPCIIVVVITALILLLICLGRFFDSDSSAEEKWGIYVPTMAAMIACGIGWIFIYSNLSPERRAEILYRIAHMTDFNETFRCVGIDDQKYSAVFLGPEQRRVLVAPKLEEFWLEKKAYVLRRVDVPESFSVLECSAQNPQLVEQLLPDAFDSSEQ
ncbi:hypothetical protein GNF76_27680 [Pseudomonas sp. CCM 7893]|uniref:Uncharacterized protein n=1 Tax=Pseudomonas spelaei TaxID=1055469 RepID=A0A6I3WCY4_9PSED|nr:hypothetical protein [Pseudomonas spelaei]MUF08125.1 hypothetical protein [Pseudomonas spelaei]